VNWIADENIESIIVQRLRASGHEVFYVAETFAEADDEQVFALAEERKSLLITEDKAFAAVCFRRRARLAGVVLLRLPGSTPTEKAARLLEVISDEGDRLIGAFTVIGPRAWRVRE
jgi:predicted nuclease of predicted toxin-antitoxin system